LAPNSPAKKPGDFDAITPAHIIVWQIVPGVAAAAQVNHGPIAPLRHLNVAARSFVGNIYRLSRTTVPTSGLPA
jgi:hypothetical protein